MLYGSVLSCVYSFFFFKQKTAYEMRISDWSSDVCSSDLLDHPGEDERRVMEALLRRASRVIVMAERGREILERVYDAELKTIAMIPHGVPNRPFAEPDDFKARFGWDGRKVVLTFGLLAPSKGIETMIEALPAAVAEG